VNRFAKHRVLLIIVFGFIIYARALGNGFVWDDVSQIVNNPYVHSVYELPSLFSQAFISDVSVGPVPFTFYKPLIYAVFNLLYSLFGLLSSPYHFFQIALHTLNALLVFALFRKVLSANIAWVLSLLFLVHPINAEAVVYLSALGDPLALTFGLSAILSIDRGGHRFGGFMLTGVLLLGSFLSKETGAIFLVLTLFWAIAFRPKEFPKTALGALLSSGVYMFLRYQAIQRTGDSALMLLASMVHRPLTLRLLSVPKIILWYVRGFVFPKDLAISQRWIVASATYADFWLPLIAVVCLGIVVFIVTLYFMRHQKTLVRTYFFFLSWFLIGLGVHLQIVPLDMTVADRWFYIPIVGLLGMIGTVIVVLHVHTKPGFWRKTSPVIAVIVLLFAGRTALRTFDWKDNATLFTRDIRISRGSYDLENYLGAMALSESDIDQALSHFRNITITEPDYWLGWNSMATAYYRAGDNRRALYYFSKATSVRFSAPSPYINQAKILLPEKPEEAKAVIQEGLTRFPKNPDLWLLLSRILEELGKPSYALAAYQQYLQLSQAAIRSPQLGR